jgi:hypothetical protein
MTNKTKAGDLDPFGRVWTLKGDLSSAMWPYGIGRI